MTQTAVEWLKFEINRRGPKEDNPPQWLKELYKQAKEMEKGQLENAWYAGDEDGAIHEFEYYYNETFKKD
jgi:hypothetical protein